MAEIKELECFVEEGVDFRMRPASHKRQWMDDSRDSFAYRCLPLSIANSYGWDILNNTRFGARWLGTNDFDAIQLETATGHAPSHAVSHFGEGVLTFHINCLFRTPPGYDLFVSGPSNQPKDVIQPLQAVIETDWSPFSFTMNWKFTHPDVVVEFRENEPIATIFPVKRGEIETFRPVIKKPEDDPELWQAFSNWRASRGAFIEELDVQGSEANKKKWQKGYFGGPPEKLDPPHRTKLRLKDFE